MGGGIGENGAIEASDFGAAPEPAAVGDVPPVEADGAAPAPP